MTLIESELCWQSPAVVSRNVGLSRFGSLDDKITGCRHFAVEVLVNWRPDWNSGLTRTRLLTAACTAATGTVRSGMALPSTSPSSCMMTRWEICWATGSRILSMVLVWNTGIVNDFYRSPDRRKAAGRSSTEDPPLPSPLLSSPLLSSPTQGAGQITSCQFSHRDETLMCLSPGVHRLLWWAPRWRLDSDGRCPPVGATQIVTEGIAALRPITAKEYYSCQAGWCWCALTIPPHAHARTHINTHTARESASQITSCMPTAPKRKV